MNIRERTLMAIGHADVSPVPVDYKATDVITSRLLERFGLADVEALNRRLSAAIRWVGPKRDPANSAAAEFYAAPAPNVDVHAFGFHRRWGEKDAFGDAHYIELPRLAGEIAVANVEALSLPQAEWFDFSTLPAACDDFLTLYNSGSYMLIAGGLRGMEDLLVDMVANKPAADALIGRIHEMMMSFARRSLAGPGGKPDIVRVGSDFASANALTISLRAFREFFLPRIRELVACIHAGGALAFFHCCGAMSELIPDLIDAGIDLLDPVQTVCPGMEPERLKREFGRHLTFHAGVDTMHLLPEASPGEVRDAVGRLIDVLGAGGGYIMGPSNGFRSDTPIENVLALYRAAGIDI
ncbi:MAG: hypothetical protein BIFFINMI_01599 [Phycisphaerae bacterium]|nr:hypothetical protein [Phycisphaerae bacterium]